MRKPAKKEVILAVAFCISTWTIWFGLEVLIAGKTLEDAFARVSLFILPLITGVLFVLLVISPFRRK